jgi:hypothetical protein
MIPASQVTFDNAELLLMATEEIHTYMLPRILSDRENYYLSEAGARQATVPNQAEYDIPYRAVGKMAQDVVLVDAAGNQQSLVRIEPESVATFNLTSTGSPRAFFFRNNKIVLSPTPNSANEFLHTPYYIRPSLIVEVTEAAQITAINTVTNTVTVASLPSTIGTTTEIDFVKNRPGFECLAIDITISSIVGLDLVFDSLPAGLIVNDWIALSEQTPMPQIPAELHPVAAQRVAVQVLGALGDVNGLRIAAKALETMEEQAYKLTHPRVHGEPRKVIVKSWWR